MKDIIFPFRFDFKKKIGIFSSSSSILDLPETQLYSYLRDKGLNIFEHPQCRVRNNFTAGTVTERVNAIHNLFTDDSISMLMAFWGGNNSNDLLDFLDYELIKNNPKIIVGYSDTSAILQAITKKTGLVTFLGPAAITFIKPNPFEFTWEYFNQLLINPKDRLHIIDSEIFADDEYYLREDKTYRITQKNTGRKVFRHGSFKGQIVASNLDTLMLLSGTQFFPDLRNKMLFIEESENESRAKIARNFRHLCQIPCFNELGALIVGRFCTKSGLNSYLDVENLFNETLENTKFPVIYNLDFGHSDPIFTIPNGGIGEVNTQENNLFIYKSVR